VREGIFAFRTWKLDPRAWLKNKFVLAGGAGLAVVLASCFALGPVVRARAETVAREHGMTVEIGRVWPALGGVRLKNVRFRTVSPEWLSGELETVDVGVGFTFGLRSVSVRKGHISITGSLDEVADKVRSETKTRRADGGESARSGPELSLEDVALTWTGLFDTSSSLEIEKINGERVRSGDDRETGFVKVGSIHVKRGGVGAKARGILARFSRSSGKMHWSEANVDGMDLEVPLEATALAAAAPATINSKTTVDEEGPGRRGFVAQARQLHARLIALASWTAEHVDDGAPVEVKGLAVLLTRGDQKLNIGPGTLHVGHRPDALEVDFAPGQSESRAKNDPADLRLHARIPASPGEIAVHLEGGPVTLASLGVREQDFGLFDVAKAKLEAKGTLTLSSDAERVSFDGAGHLSSLSLVHRALSDEPVRGLELAWRAGGVAELDGSLFRLDEGKVELGAIRLEAFGAIENKKDFVRIDGRANVPLSDCQKMFASLPQAFIPKLAGMSMAGSFSLRAGFSLDTRHPDDMLIDWDLKNHCRITKAPPDIDVVRFSRPFRRTVYDEHGEKVEMVSGPGTPDWVPLQAISPFMEAAVTTTEDGGFRNHGGFDKTAIKNSIRDNLRAGRFLRGASTISMQLAKNIYLEREKNLSRKLQEAVLTTYLEQTFTKDEILELYFNVVEFGPMIYGIGPAAAHYFDTSASDLSLGQALFLTSILPAPKRTYFSATGQVTKGWLGYLHRLMKIMRVRNKINDEQLLDGVSEVITYQVAKSPRVRPSTDIQRDLGTDVPWTLPDGP
jgi:hypothetical protein